MSVTSALFYFAICSIAFQPTYIQARRVSIDIQAPWEETSPLHETALFMEQHGHFEAFLDLLMEKIAHTDIEAFSEPKALLDLSKSIAHQILRSNEWSLYEAAISIRHFSPKVEACREVVKEILQQLIASIEDTETVNRLGFVNIQYNGIALVTSDKETIKSVLLDNADLATLLENGHNRNKPLYETQGNTVCIECSMGKSNSPPESTAPPDTLSITLFGTLHSRQTAQLYQSIQTAKQKCKKDVNFTYYEIPSDSLEEMAQNTPQLPLTGYDVSFIVKSTEYKAFDTLKTAGTTKDSAQASFESPKDINIQNSTIEPSSLEISEAHIPTMGQRASATIIRSHNPLETLRGLATALPRHISSLTELKITSKNNRRVAEIIAKTQELHHGLYNEGETLLFLFGRKYDVAESSIFDLLDAIFAERSLMHSMSQVALKSFPEENVEFHGEWLRVTLDAFTTVQADTTHANRISVPSEHILWLNDLENDAMYAPFPDDPARLFTSPYPIPIRKNLFQCVILLDPSKRSNLRELFMTLAAYQHMIAVRIGFAFATLEHTAETRQTTAYAISAFYQALVQNARGDPSKGLRFLSLLAQSVEEDTISFGEISQALRDILQSDVSLEGFLESADTEVLDAAAASIDHFRRSAFADRAAACFLNGLRMPCSASPERAFLREMEQIHPLVLNKKLSSETADCQSVLMKAFGAIERFHSVHFAEAEFLLESEYITLADKVKHLHWIEESDSKARIAPVSLLFCIDVSSLDGLALLATATEYAFKQRISGGRIAFYVYAKQPVGYLGVLEALIAESHIETLAKALESLQNAHKSGFDVFSAKSIDFAETLPFLRPFLENDQRRTKPSLFAGITGNESIALLNGRILPLAEYARAGTPLDPADFAVLSHKTALSLQNVISHIEDSLSHTATQTASSDAFHIAHALFRRDASLHGERAAIVPTANTESLDGFLLKNSADPLFPAHSSPLTAVIDPLSLSAAKALTLLEALQNILHTDAYVVLNHKQTMAEAPVLHFTSHNLNYSTNAQSTNCGVYRDDLPENILFSVTVSPPSSWVVFAKTASIDPDNIRLGAETASHIPIVYELHAFALQGVCENTAGANMRIGNVLRLEAMGMGNESHPPSETLAMAPSGYFQLQHSLGLWGLSLKERNGAQKIRQVWYNRKPVTAMPDSDGNARFPLFHKSFANVPIRVEIEENVNFEKVTEKGFEEKNVHFDENLSKSLPPSDLFFHTLRNQIRAFLTFKPKKPSETVHIFSIASGHLYERFLRLMMFRATRTTASPVKFWFIADFLSPRFKALLPHLSRKLGCSYELVSYKWPHWLRRQTTRQRHIWAYKILFLDVLFPQSVSRVIFVDADQIVQSDIAALYATDLHGRAVGFVPLCVANARNSTRRFRFWDSGHWRSHLDGKPYHISAIFVVDLKEFRRIGAGDIYRSTYQGLTADPKNLANLDQDLPNHLHDVVPIHSLPQEWLWCESWCDDASLRRAKTIDLCNNPLTKEPKIDVAMRVIPKWKAWDAELRAFEEEVLGEGGGCATAEL